MTADDRASAARPLSSPWCTATRGSLAAATPNR